jgi:ribose transport system permease protein
MTRAASAVRTEISTVDPTARPTRARSIRDAVGAVGRRGGYLVLLAVILIFGLAKPDIFFTLSNLRTISELSAVPAILAIGITPVLLAGEFDLAFTSIGGVAAAIAAVLMAQHGFGAVPAVAVALLVGMIGGAANATVVVYQRVESFIGTLAVGSVAAGIEIAVGHNAQIYNGISPSLLTFLNDKPALGLTTAVWIAVIMAIVLAVLIRMSTIGHQLGAIGGNSEAAAFAGIQIRRRLTLVFVLSGLLAAIAGVVLIGRANSYSPNAASGYLLSSYTAAFVALAFNARNRFSIGGTLLGILLLAVLQNGLNLTNQPTWAESLINGIVLIVAVRVTLGRSRRA